MKTPLKELVLTCSDCGMKADGEQVNNDDERFHDYVTGNCVRLPRDGLDDAKLALLAKMAFRCECCQEEEEERS